MTQDQENVYIVLVCGLRPFKVEAEGLGVRDQHLLHSKFKASQGYCETESQTTTKASPLSLTSSLHFCRVLGRW